MLLIDGCHCNAIHTRACLLLIAIALFTVVRSSGSAYTCIKETEERPSEACGSQAAGGTDSIASSALRYMAYHA